MIKVYGGGLSGKFVFERGEDDKLEVDANLTGYQAAHVIADWLNETATALASGVGTASAADPSPELAGMVDQADLRKQGGK